MIQSFASKNTAKLFARERVAQYRAFEMEAREKLEMLNAATRIEDLKSPPGNRLEKLVGARKGQWSIRINRQWRICFYWENGHSYNVEIVDYH